MAEATQKPLYFENLDGLRFVAAFCVMLSHSFYTDSAVVKSSALHRWAERATSFGFLGVDFFFVLSGFLITYLLFHEFNRKGKISLFNFYIRRTLRIWPLYFLMVFFGFMVQPLLKQTFGQVAHETASVPLYLLFGGNFSTILYGPPDSSTLGILWSVSVEEQFYVFWPLALSLFFRIRLWIIASGIGASFLFGIYYADRPEILQLHTFSVSIDMLVGAGLAYFAFQRTQAGKTMDTLSRTVILGTYVLLAVLSWHAAYLVDNDFFAPYFRPIIAALFSIVLLDQVYSSKSFIKVGKIPGFTWLGKISYGLYCYQMISILASIYIVRAIGLQDSPIAVVFVSLFLAFVINVIISAISFRYFESIFLNFKKRFI